MGLRSATKYSDEQSLRAAVIEACKKKYEDLYGEPWMGARIINVGFYEKRRKTGERQRDLAERLVTLYGDLLAYARDVGVREGDVFPRVALSLVRHIDELCGLAATREVGSARTFMILSVTLFGLPESIAADKRRRTSVRRIGPTRPKNGERIRLLTDSEIAVHTLLAGFFPEMQVRENDEKTVADVMRAEAKAVREARRRLSEDATRKRR